MMPNDLAGLASVNTYLSDFDNQYELFIENDHVIDFQKWITKKVETILKVQEKSFSSTIDKAVDIKTLVALESTYFRGVAKLGSKEVGDLVKRILHRRSDIEDDLIVKRLADIKIKEKKVKKLIAQYDAAENTALRKAGFVFNTKDIRNRELFINFLTGNFDDIPFSREDLIFLIMIDKYREEYAKICGYALPANKVQIVQKICLRESYTEDSWGNKSNRRCLKWIDQSTDLYATRELNSAVQLVHSNDKFRSLGLYWDEIRTGSQITNVTITSIQSDIALLLQSNDCNSKAIKRFEENLIRYATGSEPITLNIDN